jgi:hypothetical protein
MAAVNSAGASSDAGRPREHARDIERLKSEF